MFTDEYFSSQVFARTGGGEGAQPNAESCRKGKEGSKITKNVQTSFMDGPLHTFYKNRPIKVQIFRLATARIKIHQIPQKSVFLQTLNHSSVS